jgi:hypothetical protein
VDVQVHGWRLKKGGMTSKERVDVRVSCGRTSVHGWRLKKGGMTSKELTRTCGGSRYGQGARDGMPY